MGSPIEKREVGMAMQFGVINRLGNRSEHLFDRNRISQVGYFGVVRAEFQTLAAPC
jgi:hypothetical protein